MSQVHLSQLDSCTLLSTKQITIYFPFLSFLSFVSHFTFILCSVSLLPSKPLSVGNSILHSAADSVTSAVQKASQALNERGERLGRAEDRTADMMNSAEQFAVTAHKVRQYVSKIHYNADPKGGLTVGILIHSIEILTLNAMSGCYRMFSHDF